MSEPFDAIVLAGGRGRRLGGVDKALILIDGERMIDRTVRAARRSGAVRAVVVGPERAAVDGAVLAREDPPFSGPLAAVAAALPLVASPWTMLLPCDLEHPELVCERLVAAAGELGAEDDGVLLRDTEGRAQWLAGMHRTADLRRGVERLAGRLADRPLRLLFTEMRVREVAAPSRVTADIDLPEDLERVRSYPTSERGGTR